MELARLFSQLKPPLKYPVDLIAYTLEEPPFFRSTYMGSALHARTLAQGNFKVKIMISLDMIGCFDIFSDPEPVSSFHLKYGKIMIGKTTSITGKKGSEAITIQLAKLMSQVISDKELSIVALNFPLDISGVDFSDHLNFWNHNYDAVMISNAFVCPNPNYHKLEDTIKTIDFKKMSCIVHGVYHAVISYE